MRLSRAAQNAHAEAMALVDSGRALTPDEREQVLETYREDAQHLNGRAGAFFTPMGLAHDFALHVPDGARVLDLCAGIGRLSYATGFQDERRGPEGAASIVCVEQNADYARVGRAVLPRATWICADAFDVAAYQHLGPFDCVIANPPFGRIKTAGDYRGRYTGGLFEFRLIDLADTLAPYGVFIVPQESAPFRYSGRPGFEPKTTGIAHDFEAQTGIRLLPNVGVDTAIYADQWNGTSPKVEIVILDRSEQ
jgi:hypothetical protein